MKVLHTKKRMFAFFMPGFLAGILYVNLTAGQYMADSSIFSEYFLEQYASVEVTAGEYIFYLMGVRMLPFLVITVLLFTGIRKGIAMLVLVWTGFSGGMLLAMAVLSMGVKGIILCIVGMFPHFLFYIPAYIVLLWYAMTYPQNRWNQQKTIFVVLTMTIGIILEGYASPVLMKAFLGTL